MKGIIREPQFDSLRSARMSLSNSIGNRGSDLSNIVSHISSNVMRQSQVRVSRVGVNIENLKKILMDISNDPDKIKKIIKVQAYVRGKQIRRIYLKTLKKAKVRVQVIKELVSTESKYVSQLKTLHTRVQIPFQILSQFSNIDERKAALQELNLPLMYVTYLQDIMMKASDITSLFANLIDLLELNQQFSTKMNKKTESLTFHSIFTDVCVEYAPYLRIYVDYFNNYEKATATLNKLTSSSEKFSQLRNYIEQEELNGHDFIDYLIKPVQRLPKYVLLLRELKKNTPSDHEDYANVVNAMEKFDEVCSHNNEQMDSFIRENKLVELHRRFCLQKNARCSSVAVRMTNYNGQDIQNSIEQHANQGLQIIEPGMHREFLWEEEEGSLQLFENNEEKRVTVYFLSDMLLVSARTLTQREVLIKYLVLSEGSFLKNMADLKYFSYLFRVIGNIDSLTFSAENDEKKGNLIQRINKQVLIPLKLKARQRMIQQQQQLNNNKGVKNELEKASENEGNQELGKQLIYENGQNGVQDDYKKDGNKVIDEQNIVQMANKNIILSGDTQQQQQLKQSQESQRLSSQQTPQQSQNQISQLQQLSFPIQVYVLGTEERASTNKLKETFTVYITEIQIGDQYREKMFLRYKELIEVEKYVRKNIKEIQDVPHLSRDFFWHHKTKVIEQRKLLIENFLQKLLSNPILRSHNKTPDLLAFLNLPMNFFEQQQSQGFYDYLGQLDQTQQKGSQDIGNNNSNNNNSITNNNNNSKNITQGQTSRGIKVSYFNENIVESDGEDNEEQLNYETAVDSHISYGSTMNSSNNDKCNEDGCSQQKIKQQGVFRPVSVGASSFYNLNSQKLRNPQGILISQSGNGGLEDSIGIQQSQQLFQSNDQNRLSTSQGCDNNSNINRLRASSSSEEEREIEVLTLSNTKPVVRLFISRNSKVFDVCQMVATQLGLKNYLDFKLFMEDEKKNSRLLDDDEPMYKLIFNPSGQLESTSTIKSLLNKLRSKPSQQQQIQIQNNNNNNITNTTPTASSSSKIRIRFTKYLWLEQELEEFDYKIDHVRLQLIAAQVLQDISNKKYLLQSKDYLLYTALYLFINHESLIGSNSNNNNTENLSSIISSSNIKQYRSQLLAILKSFLPSMIFKQTKENILIDNLLVYINTISDELSLAITAGNQVVQENNSNNNNILGKNPSGCSSEITGKSACIVQPGFQDLDSLSNSNSEGNKSSGSEDVEHHLLQVNSGILSDRRNIACMVLLDSFKRNPLYGATLFNCSTYKTTIKSAKLQKLIIPPNVICCVKCDAIHILDATTQKRIKTFKYHDIKETKVFPSSIIFVIASQGSSESTNTYRFDTTQSYEISSIMGCYQDMMTDIEKNALTLDEEEQSKGKGSNVEVKDLNRQSK